MDTWHKLYESISFVTTQRKSVKNTNARGFISDTNNTKLTQKHSSLNNQKQIQDKVLEVIPGLFSMGMTIASFSASLVFKTLNQKRQCSK